MVLLSVKKFHGLPDDLKLTVRDPKVSHFFQQKRLEKWDTLGAFTQKVPFLNYNKTQKEKVGNFGVMDCI